MNVRWELITIHIGVYVQNTTNTKFSIAVLFEWHKHLNQCPHETLIRVCSNIYLFIKYITMKVFTDFLNNLIYNKDPV